MKGKMWALVLHAPGDLRYEQIDIPTIEKGEVLVRVKVSGICGSDVPRIMKKGTYSFPLVPGHEFSGEVAQIRNGDRLQVGQKVTVYPLLPCQRCQYCKIGRYNLCENYSYLGSRANGGFAEYVRVPLKNVLSLPPGVNLEDAALCEPGAVALHGLRRARIRLGDKVVIMGAGTIGLLLAQWCFVMGAYPLIVDVVEEKLRLARLLGVKSSFNFTRENLKEKILEDTDGQGADVLIEAAGVPEAFVECLNLVRKGGKVILLGNMEDSVVLNEEKFSLILRKELTLYGSWNSYFNQISRDDWQITLDQLKQKKLHFNLLISHRFKLSEGVELFQKMNEHRQAFQKVVFVI